MVSDLRRKFFLRQGIILTCSFLPLADVNANFIPNTFSSHGDMVDQANSQKDITGKVLNEVGEPIPGASILVEGSSRGVITDLDGIFTIKVSPTDKLIVSFLGMESQTITVGNQTNLVVKMAPKVAELSEVTVVAYGKQRKASVIGAINTISTSELKTPVGKLSSGLAGQLAGLVVMQRSGEPGAGADFWIRGINTFGANNKPLVLVDGIERELDLVDPEDIASFSILR